MRPTQFITLEIYQNNQWVDYTDGLINAEIIRGVEEYTGPLVQPEVGQLTLTSRNPNLDPYNNANIKYNAKIRVNAGSTRIFTGRIEGIDVEYKPKNEPTIVTINAFDLIGTMYKHKLSEGFIDNYESWSTITLLNQLSATGEVAEWQNYVIDTDGTLYSEGPIELGTTVYDALNTRVKTDLGFYFANARNEIEYYRRDRNDPLHPFNANPALITFDYDGNDTSYRTISLNDGFEKIVNEVVITGTGDIDTTNVTVTAGDSVNLWGKTSATAELATDNIASLQAIANEILVEMAEPIREIYEISWDATLDVDTAKTVDIMDNIHINHTINQTTSIDRKYGIVGLKHEINADNWIVTYVVRNYDYQTTSIPNPVIVITPPSGGAEVDFTFSYTHPNPELITGQSWDLDDGFTSTAPSTVVNYLSAGTKTIVLTINTIYGYSKTTIVELEVGIAPPVASFTYSIDANNVYNFVFTGSGLGQILWDFGDGTASTDTNPTKFFTTSGNKTITVTATNSFGTDTDTQVINTVAISTLPIRYVRFKWFAGLNQTYSTYVGQTSWGGGVYNPHKFHNIKFYDTSNVELGAGYTLVDYKDVNGFFTTTPTTLDEYGRVQATSTSLIELQDRLKGSNGAYPMAWDAGGLDNVLVDNTENHRAQRIITTFDLGTNYFSFKEPRVQRSTFSGAAVSESSGDVLVDVSFDNVNWRHIGRLDYVGTNTTSTFVPVATAPFTVSNTAVPPVEYNWTPVRYIKLDFNAPAATSANYWSLLSVTPICGRGIKGGTGRTPTALFTNPEDNYFGRGGVNLSARTGADLIFDNTNSSSVNSVVKTYTTSSNGSIAQSIINPGTSGITNWNNIDLIGSGNVSRSIIWQETTGQKTFTYDLGQPTYKFSGLYIETGALTTTGTSQNVMDGGYLVTISLSPDNINYTTIGTYSMNYTNAGPKYITGRTMIRTVPYAADPDVENSDDDYWFTPVHSTSTWQQVNALLLPTGVIS
jgi:PKD repeat protein